MVYGVYKDPRGRCRTGRPGFVPGACMLTTTTTTIIRGTDNNDIRPRVRHASVSLWWRKGYFIYTIFFFHGADVRVESHRHPPSPRCCCWWWWWWWSAAAFGQSRKTDNTAVPGSARVYTYPYRVVFNPYVDCHGFARELSKRMSFVGFWNFGRGT